MQCPDRGIGITIKDGLLAIVVAAILLGARIGDAQAQSKPLEFDVASVRQNVSDQPVRGNVSLTDGNFFEPAGGTFSGHNILLVHYISFAYKLSAYQESVLAPNLPGWAQSAHFDIEARADPAVTKDQLREMMRSLFSERFRLAAHHETRPMPAFTLVIASGNRLGPSLQAQPPSDPACTKPAPHQIVCGAFDLIPSSAPGRRLLVGRGVPMATLARVLTSYGNLGRPTVDQTGLTGLYNFSLEWTPEIADLPAGSDFQPDPSGPSFLEAVAEQLGVKLVGAKAPVDVLVLDHIERPTGN